jgi:hypothetical protein
MLKFCLVDPLKHDELPTTNFLKLETLNLLPLPERVRACCEDESEDILEVNYCIHTGPDGKQRFERAWSRTGNKSVKELEYDQIIKLTYGHFICRNDSHYVLFAINRNELGQEELQPTVRFTSQEDFFLEQFLQTLSEEYPHIYKEVSTYLYRIPEVEGYISLYRLYIRWLVGSDISIPLAYQTVILDNHFNITPFRVIDYYDRVRRQSG